jgi:hypothetical protein
LLKRFCNEKKQGQKARFCNPTRRPKNANGNKKTIQETKFFEIDRFERATRAKKKNAYICLEIWY